MTLSAVDGRFRASHRGGQFTHRLAALGTGQGETFAPLDLGEPDWSRLQVWGDTAEWFDVFPDANLRLRYIHDMPKVEVIAKRAFMDGLRASVQEGLLDAEGRGPNSMGAPIRGEGDPTQRGSKWIVRYG